MRGVWLNIACGLTMCAAPSVYTGSQACAPCHARIYRLQIESGHARALRPIRGSELEKYLKGGSIAERGGYKLAYADAPTGLAVTARGAGDETTGLLEWAFGSGQIGITAVGRFADGKYFEHRVSYYTEAKAIGITPGQPIRASATAMQALGVTQGRADIYQCFSCHSTGLREQSMSSAPLDLAGMVAGVQCERCHGPGEEHVDAAKRRADDSVVKRTIYRPARSPASASVTFCGQCHRLPDPRQHSIEPERVEPIAVRFQPMGLLASRCFRIGQGLSCLTCHDPHTNAVRNDSAYYSRKCTSCHTGPAAMSSKCPRTAQTNCLPCHMRRSSPFPHFTFTDHRIRVYER